MTADPPRRTARLPDLETLATRITAGERRALARAITLIESTRDEDRAQSTALLQKLSGSGRQALRIGLSGTPGVGKSTFIEAFGMALIAAGLLARLIRAADPEPLPEPDPEE